MRIYLDANVFVAAIERTDRPSKLVQELLKLGKANPGMLVSSELTLAELLVKPLQALSAGLNLPKDAGGSIVLTPGTLATLYCDLIEQGPGLEVVPVDRSILILAAYRRAEDATIKLPDAIHLATAEQSQCSLVLSDDRKLRPSAQHGFSRVALNVASLEQLLAKVASR